MACDVTSNGQRALVEDGVDAGRSQPRILIVADHASARFGGEAMLPLQYFRLLRKRGIDVQMVVHERTREELQSLLGPDIDRVHFIPDTKLHRTLYRLGLRLPHRIKLFTTGLLLRLATQASARKLARKLIRQRQIDILHQPIPVSPKELSLMHGMGAPVVIGPLNGGMDYPAGFKQVEGKLVRGFTRLARGSASGLHRLLPGKLRADTVLVAGRRTKDALPAGLRGKVVELVENGVDLSLWRSSVQPPASADAGARFVFVGRLVDWKAVDLLLRAFHKVKDARVSLDIFGDGPERRALESLATQLDLGKRVVFHGSRPQADIARQLPTYDALVLSSLFECGGAVVLEAMACGLPVIASNWGGPADYLDSNCGLLVDLTSPEQFVDGLADAMTRLAADPQLRLDMGRAGRQRVVREFDWERKIDRMLEIFDETIARGTARG